VRKVSKSLNVSVARASLAGFLRDQSGQSAPKSRSLQHKLRSKIGDERAAQFVLKAARLRRRLSRLIAQEARK
jgi:hypothetical protein